MGMYDTVHLRCKDCGGGIETQTKAGECTLADYGEDDCPESVRNSLDGERVWCRGCKKEKVIRKATVTITKRMLVVEDVSTEDYRIEYDV